MPVRGLSSQKDSLERSWQTEELQSDFVYKRLSLYISRAMHGNLIDLCSIFYVIVWKLTPFLRKFSLLLTDIRTVHEYRSRSYTISMLS